LVTAALQTAAAFPKASRSCKIPLSEDGMPSTPARLRIDPPYDRVFEGVLAFATFESAENSLGRLEKLRQGYEAAGDKKGVEYCRRIAREGRRRAELIARNRRVGIKKRLQKQEIAVWFRVWLETPGLFEDWLALRKSSGGFRKLQEAESLNSTGQKTD
jgi:hypothetical protein